MRLVKELESGGVAGLGLLYGSCLGQVTRCPVSAVGSHIAPSKEVGPSANLRRPSESFRPWLSLKKSPNSLRFEPAVEEGNPPRRESEADVTETLSPDDGLLTLLQTMAVLNFHRSPPKAGLRFLVDNRFGAFPDPCRPLKRHRAVVMALEYFEVVDSDSDFGFVAP